MIGLASSSDVVCSGGAETQRRGSAGARVDKNAGNRRRSGNRAKKGDKESVILEKRQHPSTGA